MAAKALITRRAALVGALASSAALAVPAAAAAGTPPMSVQDRLSILARKFIKDDEAIDPTIRQSWIGNDMLADHRGDVLGVWFDRREQPRRKRTA